MPSLAREIFEGLITHYYPHASAWHVSEEHAAVDGNESSIRFNVTLAGKKRSFSIEAAEHPVRLVSIFEGAATEIIQTESLHAMETVSLFAKKIPVPA